MLGLRKGHRIGRNPEDNPDIVVVGRNGDDWSEKVCGLSTYGSPSNANLVIQSWPQNTIGPEREWPGNRFHWFSCDHTSFGIAPNLSDGNYLDDEGIHVWIISQNVKYCGHRIGRGNRIIRRLVKPGYATYEGGQYDGIAVSSGGVPQRSSMRMVYASFALDALVIGFCGCWDWGNNRYDFYEFRVPLSDLYGTQSGTIPATAYKMSNYGTPNNTLLGGVNYASYFRGSPAILTVSAASPRYLPTQTYATIMDSYSYGAGGLFISSADDPSNVYNYKPGALWYRSGYSVGSAPLCWQMSNPLDHIEDAFDGYSMVNDIWYVDASLQTAAGGMNTVTGPTDYWYSASRYEILSSWIGTSTSAYGGMLRVYGYQASNNTFGTGVKKAGYYAVQGEGITGNVEIMDSHGLQAFTGLAGTGSTHLIGVGGYHEAVGSGYAGTVSYYPVITTFSSAVSMFSMQATRTDSGYNAYRGFYVASDAYDLYTVRSSTRAYQQQTDVLPDLPGNGYWMNINVFDVLGDHNQAVG